MKSLYEFRNGRDRGLLILTATLALLPMTASRSMAQDGPNTVLLFPAVVTGAGSSAKLAEEVVTDAVKKYLNKAGVNVVLYSKRLPSIQRASAENEKMFSEKDIDAGPGDEPRKLQRYAEVVGATEYVTVFVDSYTFDSATRTAKFNLALSRYNTATGTSTGTYGKVQQGTAPADIAKPRQEGSGAARAAEVGADEGVRSLYPLSPSLSVGPVPKPKRKSGADKQILPIFGAALGILYFSTR